MDTNLKILLVEDNYEHLRLTRYILEQNKVPGDLFVVRDGQEAMDYLYRRNRFIDPLASPRPDLILLDFNIPRVDGKEVLKTIKGDAALKDIPVVVVSSSTREEDVTYAQSAGASAYISKSLAFEDLSLALGSIHKFASTDKGANQ
ncbi:response regulator [bacterium]|nr:MAG: response regulator [bacterium]